MYLMLFFVLEPLEVEKKDLKIQNYDEFLKKKSTNLINMQYTLPNYGIVIK